jgi:hypothetical protein
MKNSKRIGSKVLAGAAASLAIVGLLVGTTEPATSASEAKPAMRLQEPRIRLVESESTEMPVRTVKPAPIATAEIKSVAQVQPQAAPKPKTKLQHKAASKPKAKPRSKSKTTVNIDGGLWDRIAACESSGNWSASNPSGKYTGGLQFDRATWLANGGGKYAPYAGAATKAQQIEIANVLKSRRGLAPWECAGKLGLR